jgi:hypothetical protein
MIPVWRKSGRDWRKNWILWYSMNCMENIRLLHAGGTGKSPTGISEQAWSAGQFPLVVFLDDNGQGRVTLL